MNSKIEKEKLRFIFELENKSENFKKRAHFYSVVNISESIIQFNDFDSNALKEKLLEYFYYLNSIDYELIGKEQSLKLYRTYISPIGKHLIWQDGFRTKADIFKFITIGIILDVLCYLSIFELFYPITSVLLFFIGCYKQKKKIKNNKFFNMYW